MLLFSCRSNEVIQGDRTSQENDNRELVVESEFEKIEKTDEEWRRVLSPNEYYIARQQGTEHAFGSAYKEFKNIEKASNKEGVWVCAACGNELFSANTSFDSGSGWPSFYEPYGPNSVIEKKDYSHGWVRTEVLCAKCGAHLGHVFDGEGMKTPTDRRFCINAGILDHEAEEE